MHGQERLPRSAVESGQTLPLADSHIRRARFHCTALGSPRCFGSVGYDVITCALSPLTCSPRRVPIESRAIDALRCADTFLLGEAKRSVAMGLASSPQQTRLRSAGPPGRRTPALDSQEESDALSPSGRMHGVHRLCHRRCRRASRRWPQPQARGHPR